MQRSTGFIFPAIFLLGILLYLDFGAGIFPYEPTFISEWNYVKAQDDTKSELFVHFPDSVDKTTRPVKVIVEVRVKDGGNSYIFNAFGSSTRDDDSAEKYGGVIYFYNASGVIILLPSSTNQFKSGGAVYCGEKKDWYYPTSHENKTINEIDFVEAEVRVKMWQQKDMPPRYDSGFVYTMTSRNLSKGAGRPACLRCGFQAGSLTFAFNASHVRLWVKYIYPVISAMDGWGRNEYYHFGTRAVRVRILAWTLENAVNLSRMTTKIGDHTTTTPKLVFPSETVTKDLLVQVLIRPLSGPNGGFSFYGAGSVVTFGGYGTSNRYSGLVYGYNNFGVYVWRVKPTNMSYVFDIDYPWGSGRQRQQTNDVEIDIRVIELMKKAKRTCMCPCDKVHAAKYTSTKEEALTKEIVKMKKELMVFKNETSVAMKKKISVKDSRPSAVASGVVWVIFLLAMVGFIVIPDVISGVRYKLPVLFR
ncbi:uncharacterized protein LOC134235290 [Saccostrea cucullata]|uniref:uncharacterized protein LOC134235290 n=1 Tax=Saccostrea cuccullata TaxID=36930 RepID=UPI002ED13F52